MRPNLRSSVLTPRQLRAANRDTLRNQPIQLHKKSTRTKVPATSTAQAKIHKAKSSPKKSTISTRDVMAERNADRDRESAVISQDETMDTFDNTLDTVSLNSSPIPPLDPTPSSPTTAPVFFVKKVETIRDGNMKTVTESVSTQNEEAESTYRRLQNEIIDALAEKEAALKTNGALESQLQEVQKLAHQHIMMLQQQVENLRNELQIEKHSSADLLNLLVRRA